MINDKMKNILLVEDDAIIAMMETMQLKKYGYNVIHALNSKTAIEAFNDNAIIIDLVLMDINLGEDIDGTVVAKIILQEHNVPLLFLSNHTEREVVDRTENITFYGYVVKDSGITVLDASIKMAFRLHQAYQEMNSHKIEIDNKKKELQMLGNRYRKLFEAAQDGILVLSADTGMIVDVNPYLIKMLGYSKIEFLEKYIWDISAFKNIAYSKQLFEELQEKEYVRYEDLPLETYDGTQIHVEFVSNVYLVDKERVVQCNIRDITKRIAYEKLLTEDIKNKQDLLKEIQHRTKNSFNIITSLIQLRSNVTTSEETKGVLNELALRVGSISVLYSLLYETNSFYEIQLKEYCNKVIDSMIKMSGNIIINKDINDVVASTRNAALIGMILVEIFSNSAKYAFPDGAAGILNIELKAVDNQVRLIIEDNGIGLPKGFDIANTESMGFHLVFLMVSQLNGTIKRVESKGTKIVIEFPLETSFEILN
jgi:PAS domain S-box-containing protein